MTIERLRVRNAEQIAEIAQSESIWNAFVQSELFAHAAPNAEVLNEAYHILEKKLIHFEEGHPNRERKEKALARLTLAMRNPALSRAKRAKI
jgi:hypothetical protein